VKLLFDQNLSPRLVAHLGDIYPQSAHVREVDLERADDSTVWKYAAEHGFTIISKDSDFHQRSLLFGYPPKVIWVRLGNCSTGDVEELLRRSSADIRRFQDDDEAAFLALA
jgi:predicted nuclease of predicted toxin-antitoxin system